MALLGDPVSHSLSPRMQRAALSEIWPNRRFSYSAIRVLSEEFESKVHHLQKNHYTGCNVTLPHKAAAAHLAIPDDKYTKALQIANTLKFVDGRILARNTDVPGFLAPIKSHKPGRALVLGAGGAALAAIFALSKSGWEVVAWNRNSFRLVELQRLVKFKPIADPNPDKCKLVVNATSLGLKKGELPPLMWSNFEKDATLYDLAYQKGSTDFIKRAQQEGKKTIDGREMLVEQGALSLEWWTGLSVPRETMRLAVGLTGNLN